MQLIPQSPSMKKKASSLLVAIFFMSLLTSLTLGVSLLVARDVQTVRTTVAGVQGRYAAEGMNELGLHILKENLPGFEPQLDSYELQSSALGALDVKARGSQVPCNAEWRRLSYQESVQLPLFAQVSHEGTTEKIELFHVEFYLGDFDGNPIAVTARDADVLRWRITGLRNDNDETEAISEFIPLKPINSSQFPTQFGTLLEDATEDAYSQAKYVDSSSKIFHESYRISDFVRDHKLNYLSLTNAAAHRPNEFLFVRLISRGSAQAVCEFVTLASQSTVEFGDSQKSLDTVVREGENLPVFDFVIYHTSGKQ